MQGIGKRAAIATSSGKYLAYGGKGIIDVDLDGYAKIRGARHGPF
jgi:hypothetical protein